ncbi:MAG: polyprenyl synthetase family protein [Planctomycetes bacterium]|nr:polyprenyl synthetase family protein [Planctomycetota bacterium]
MESLFEERRQGVESLLRSRLDAATGWPAGLAEAARYSLMAGGKRFRPLLAWCAAEALGEPPPRYGDLYVALECVHTYSLIHDDLPAMDDDDLRRGVPTCHVKFGEAAAILAGDGLLTWAFELLAAPEFAARFRAECLLAAIHLLARAAGNPGMVGGQYIDTCEPPPARELDLAGLHARKTGALIAASASIPAVLADSDLDKARALSAFGTALGLAFQVADDILNVVGDPRRMGKAVGSDERRGKLTYPALLGLDGARERLRDLVREAKRALGPFPPEGRRALEAMADYAADRAS